MKDRRVWNSRACSAEELEQVTFLGQVEEDKSFAFLDRFLFLTLSLLFLTRSLALHDDIVRL